MTLKRRSLLIVTACIGAMLLILYLVSNHVLINGLLRLEARLMEQNIDRVRNALAEELRVLDTNAHDWAQWDASYQFIQDGNFEYIRETLLDETLIGARLNLIIYITNDGEALFAKAFDLEAETELPFPGDVMDLVRAADGMIGHKDTESSAGGIILPRSGPPLLTASRPIITSTGEGPVMGALIMGRFLDHAMVRRLERVARLSMEFHRIDEPALAGDFREALELLERKPAVIDPESSLTVAGYGRYNAVAGGSGLVFKVTQAREVYWQGRRIIAVLLVFVLIINVGAGVLLIGLFNVQVLARLQRLARSAAEISGAPDRARKLDVDSDDEVSWLAGSINHVLDVMRRRQSELEQSEAGYRTLAANLNAGVFRAAADEEAAVERVNAALARMLGFESAERMVGVPLRDFFAEEREAKRLLNDISMVDGVRNREFKLRRRDGAPVWVLCTASLGRDEESGRTWIHGVFDDITDRKSAEDALNRYRNRFDELVEERTSELTQSYIEMKREVEERKKAETALRDAKERLEATLGALPDIMFELDEQGRILDYRAHVEDALYARPEDFIGRGVDQALPPESAAIIMEGVRQVLDTGEITRIEYPLEIDGQPMYFEAGMSPRGDPAAGGGIIALVRDITDRKLAQQRIMEKNRELESLNLQLRAGEEQLMAQYQQLEAVNQQLAANEQMLSQQNEELEAALRVKSEFLSMVSHELRTPLTPIMGYAALILRGSCGPVPERCQKPIETIMTRAKGLTKLIDDLLELSQLDRQGLELKMAPVRLRAQLAAIIDAYRELDRGKPVEIELVGGDMTVMADPGRLRQIIENLLDNSIKYSGPKVTIRIELESKGDLGLVSVADDGMGIAPEHIERIFDRFYQAEDIDTRSHGGAGLGLAIVKETVESMGGAVSVRSQPGAGAVFTVGLPMAGDHDDPAPDQAPEAETHAGPPVADSRQKTVLVIDDDIFALELVRAILEDDYQVFTASTAGEGLAVLERERIDLTLLDLMMPDMDGIEALARIKADERSRDMPVVVVSAKVEPASVKAALEAGAADMVGKPFEPAELLDRITAVLGSAAGGLIRGGPCRDPAG